MQPAVLLFALAAFAAAEPPGHEWKWADEFDGTQFDAAKWIHWLPGKRPDAVNTPDLVAGYRFFIDGRMLRETPGPVSERPRFVILSTEVDNESWAWRIPWEGYDDRGSCKVRMVVDYVRDFAKPVRPPAVKALGDHKGWREHHFLASKMRGAI